MSWRTAPEPPIAVVHDIDRAQRTIRSVLDTADERTRPGLEVAAEVLSHLTLTEDELVVEWASRVLARAEVDPRTREVEAIRELRRALPGMNLPAATALAARARTADAVTAG